MLYGERVRLRSAERDDISLFARWFNDPEVRHYLAMYLPMSIAQEERWFQARLEAENEYFFVIEASVEEEWVSIGTLGLHHVDWKNGVGDFGISLGEKKYWGLGYGTDATRTMLQFAFRELNLHRVQLDVYDYNTRAQRCYEKAGFRREGIRREAFYHEGAYRDTYSMGILRHEFENHAAD
jgi:RimJ/RimL family protein N-acetyltransferase